MPDVAARSECRPRLDRLEPDEVFRTIFANPEFVAYVLHIDDNGIATFEDANEGVAGLAGRPLDEIIDRAPADCLPPQIADCLVSNLQKCLETGKGFTYDRTLDLPQGRLSWRTSLMPAARRLGRVRHVVGLTRDITDEANQIEKAERRTALLKGLGIALPSAVYLLDIRTGSIRFIGGHADEERQLWRRGAEDAGSLAVERFFHPDDHAKAKAHYKYLATLSDGEVCTIDFRVLAPDGSYRRHSNRQTVFTRSAEGEVELVLGVSDDVSEQDRVEQEVRDLSERMLTLQIEERRRIAQELHDSTGQHLTAASLALNRIHSGHLAAASADARLGALMEPIEDARLSVDEARREIRVLSYLLHPPQIRSHGLAEAIAEFANGFARRSGLAIDVHVEPDADTIDDDVALQLFRVCQEALTNVYRHAHAKRVFVALNLDEAAIRLTVTDDGIGFNDVGPGRTMPLGVGLAGMRQRMERLGGEVQVSSGPDGTTLAASAPVQATGG